MALLITLALSATNLANYAMDCGFLQGQEWRGDTRVKIHAAYPANSCQSTLVLRVGLATGVALINSEGRGEIECWTSLLQKKRP